MRTMKIVKKLFPVRSLKSGAIGPGTDPPIKFGKKSTAHKSGFALLALFGHELQGVDTYI